MHGTVKSIIKAWFPGLGRLIVKFMPQPQGNRGVFSTYAEALAACETRQGYDSRFLSEYLVKKSRLAIEVMAKNQSQTVPDHFLQSMFVAMLAAEGKKEINVVDFGGGCAYPFAILSRLLPDSSRIQWHVVEIPSLVALAKDNISIRNADFSDSLEEVVNRVGHVDLLHSACALQYVEDPRFWLQKLVECQADHVFIGRAGFAVGGRDFITIQRSRIKDHGLSVEGIEDPEGYVEYPVSFMSKDDFDAFMKANSYELILEFGATSVFKPGGGPEISEGAYLYKLNRGETGH